MRKLTNFATTILQVFVSGLLGIVLTTSAQAADDATEVRIYALDTCAANYGGSQYSFEFDGTPAPGSFAAQGVGCTCSATPYLVTTVNDSSTLAAIGEAGCSVFTASHTNSLYINFVRAEIDRTESGTEELCISPSGTGSCQEATLCEASRHRFGTNRTLTSFVTDTDSDGTPDCSDTDDDNDGILDGADNCPLNSDPDQTDTDGNGRGDVCDPFDRDNDGIWNINDNCPDAANAGQEDTDGNGTGDACQANVVAVPWAGLPSNPHVVFNGGSIPLQASASLGVTGNPVALVSGTWDPGDGSGPQTINVSNSRVLELMHTYNGSPGQPFTATVEVTDAASNTYSDTFKVQIQPKTLDVEVNMAIDRGLWNLHKRITLSDSGGFSLGNWENGNTARDASATASVVQAFEINGHREIGDPLEDPYVDNVARGLRWLQNNIQRVNIGAQAGGDPDTNANGYGLDFGNDHPTYITGQIVDAFVASGTENAVAVIGSETNRTYGDIVQDLMDAYSWGQHEDGQGGWIYRWNSQGGIDSSASQWWAIGALAADVWDTNFTPQWVRDENRNKGIESLQRRHIEAAIPFTTWSGLFGGAPGTGTHGACSYRGGNFDHNLARTASCLVMMSANGIAKDNARFQAAEGYARRNFTTGDLHGNFYAMFALTKAMRLAKNAAGDSEPIELLGGDLDWYRADPFPATYANRNNGFARYLVGRQLANGNNGNFGASSWVGNGDLSNAFAIIILSPTLFELSPIASCTADPLIDGTAALGGVTSFDGSGSSHQDPDYAGGLTYDWDFQDGDTGAGETVDHTFANVGIYNVTLTVTDDGGLTNTTSCPVDVRDNDIPPNANIVVTANLPICEGDDFTLDGSTSVDLDNDIVLYEWDITAPVNFSTIDSTGAVLVASFATAGSYDIGLRVTDNDGSNGGSDHTDSEFTSVTVLEASDPSCNLPPTANSGGPYTVDEGGTVTLNGSGIDPDGDALTFAWDLDNNGSFETPGATPIFDAGSLDDSVVTISLLVSDSALSDNDVTTVTVNNVAPDVEAGVDQTIDENGSITLAASFTDPGTLDTHTVLVDWGDGSANGTSLAESHQYLDDDPTATPSDTYTVTVTVEDDDGGVGSDTLIVTVNNLAPVITDINVPIDPQPAGVAISVSAPFTDVGTNDTHSCTIDWDDGIGPVAATVNPQNAGSGTCTDSRTDLPAGVYGVTVIVTDDDGDSDTESATTLIVVYDPGAGFVTGGGWFNSGAGADVLNPEAVGKANFGFVAKYKKGAQVPDGQTEFQFKAGDLNFHSTDYQWLVVTGGCMAQYKGTGTINGEPGYDFILTLRDGSLCAAPTDDAFRIKITGAGGLRYDNTGGDDNIGPQNGNVQPIDGGSIKIHRKK